MFQDQIITLAIKTLEKKENFTALEKKKNSVIKDHLLLGLVTTIQKNQNSKIEFLQQNQVSVIRSTIRFISLIITLGPLPIIL